MYYRQVLFEPAILNLFMGSVVMSVVMKVMQNWNKMIMLGMTAMIISSVLVIGSCQKVFGGTTNDGSKNVLKLTLKNKSYKIEYQDEIYQGSCIKASINRENVALQLYRFTSDGTGKAEVREKQVAQLDYTNGTITIHASDLEKRAVDSGGNVYDVELIVIDED
ncbi:MAG: hypothetical protein Ta2F_12660 [Termitinemataceae bacterium]|nr:MAG: hypothetical protein Ta2F_12660 [Termitinemataceae bacterium]